MLGLTLYSIEQPLKGLYLSTYSAAHMWLNLQDFDFRHCKVGSMPDSSVFRVSEPNLVVVGLYLS